ncbi:MAG: hypothetical protein A2784_03240 [Candidatus Chisholmbacteria bacterium RIFCSPHIGHO2_01_FULL_48_12]|uniref:Spore coat protein CotH n=1 Tax=Candidatus Chisholmbacteria bacterium RIFCSPHIGHO2_01_FULL_48_12 TaxID=1797589 RepID=A0A1G1VJW3_9BACT|nr:MAG: hypothetical protein A2784_03240 [Candidatus Chisholmbacteria bacterium RIFCSPHIGHO2_01_FULL_48_12]
MIHFSRRAFLSALIPSLIFWWIVLIFLFDFHQVLLIRKTRFYLDPKFAGFHLMFNEAITRITGYDIRFSRPLDLLFLPFGFKPSQLPAYHLTVSPQDLAQLNLKVVAALRTKLPFLTDEYNISVPAQVNFAGSNYQAKFNYRGDRPSHWTGNKKSLNVNFIDPPRRLNLIIPEERGFVDAALAKHVARKLNLMVQDDDYVTVFLNGDDLGTYYQTEEMDEQFLIRRQKPIGNLYADRFGDVPWSPQLKPFDNVDDWKKKVTHPDQTKDQKQDLNQLLDWLHQQEQGKNLPNTLFDVDSFIRWQVHFLLMGNLSQDYQHNLKLYSNPQTKLFEFIVDDITFSPDAGNLFLPCFVFDINRDNLYANRLVTALNQDPEILSARNRLLKTYLSNPANLEDDLKFVNDLISRLTPELYRGIRRSTYLQLTYSLWHTPRGLKSWYDRLNHELETCY